MRCSRAWAVEAARDGRLTGAEAETVGRHTALCADCRDEAKRLDALGDALRSLPVREVDALSAKRAKQRLLSAANQAVLRPSHRVPWAAGLVAASLAGAGALAAFGLHDRTPPPAAASSLSTPPALAASVEAPEAARWSQRREGRVETVTLSEGSLSLHVRRASPAERVIVVVPDGEIEDLGTTFTVDVDQGKTMRVAVVEGSVELRRRGEPPVHIDAGETWRRPAEPASPAGASPSAMPSASGRPRALPSGEAGAPPNRLVPHGITTASPLPSGAPRPPAGAGSAGSLSPSALEQGYEAMRAGRYGEAAEHFAAAERSGPASGERGAEDAAYLRVIALVRAGDKAAAREAARAYLARFPQGFRRPEIEALAR